MKKKFGFTLAEVLITLGIIGVVAALTAPALVKNSGQAKIGPSLAKFVNTFETACEQLMTDEGASKLTAVAPVTGDNNLFDKLSSYMIMTKLDSTITDKYTIKAPDGNVYQDVDMALITSFWQLKDGSLMMPFICNCGFETKGTFKGDIIFVVYDINGLGGNNTAGKEVFMFVLDNSGILVPYKSNTFQYISIDRNNGDVCDMSSSITWDGFACTGKIADNGWKADY